MFGEIRRGHFITKHRRSYFGQRRGPLHFIAFVTRQQVACDRVILIAGTMVGPRQCDERPYKTMVPTLSEKYEDYEPLRDQTPCFLYHLRRPISVETAAGKRSANRALTALNINSEIEETHFVSLWRSFDRANTTHDEVGLRSAERVCIRAYNLLPGTSWP